MSDNVDLVIIEKNQNHNQRNGGAYKPNSNGVSRTHADGTKDGWRSWLVCVLCSSVAFVVYGFYSCYGLFLIEFLKEFKETEAKTAWVGSLATTMHFACYIICSILQHFFNVQTICIAGAVFMTVALSVTSFMHSMDLMFLTYGIVYGLGTGLSAGLLIASVPEYFDKRRAMATAVVMIGGSLGSIVYPPFIAFLLHRFSWRQVFRIALFAPACVLICSFTFKKRDLSVRTISKKQEYLTFLKDRQFLCWCFGAAMVMSTFWVTVQFMVRFSEFLGYTTDDGSFLLTYLGVCSMVGQLMTASLWTRMAKYFRSVNIMIYLTILSFLNSCLVAFAGCYWSLVLYACLHGLFFGSILNLSAVSMMDFLPGGSFRSAWGVFAFAMSAVQMAGPPVAGFLYDTYLTYTPVYLMCAATFVIADFFLVPLSWTTRNKRAFTLDQEEFILGTREKDTSL